MMANGDGECSWRWTGERATEAERLQDDDADNDAAA